MQINASPYASRSLCFFRNEAEVITMLTRNVAAVSLMFLLIPLSGTQAATDRGGALASCKADAARICPGVAPGGGRLIACLKQHENDVTIGCAKELKAIKAKAGK
jgi:hypothetical protein